MKPTLRISRQGLLRIEQICGNPAKGIPALLPICKATWWNGVKSGRFPQPIRLGVKVTCWKAADVMRLVESGTECGQ